jgi:tripartite-type tricarboxylate transporter receptor subunit TctC
MPRNVIDTMHAALAGALKQPDVVERLRQTDQEVIADSPEASAARLAADSSTWGSVARKIGLQLD